MNKYQNGKIYTIKSPNTDKIYIGSTTQKYLSSRLAQHKAHMKGNIFVSSSEIIKCGDAYIELIEMFPCNNKMELDKREGEIQKAHDNKVNKAIAGRTKKEYKQTDKSKEQQKEYIKQNEEHFKEYRKEYYLKKKEDNPEHIKEQQEKRKELIKCPNCDMEVQKKALTRHQSRAICKNII